MKIGYARVSRYSQLRAIKDAGCEIINQRAAEERKTAREKGVVFGCKRKLDRDEVPKMENLIAIGMPKSEIVELFGIGRTSVFTCRKEYGYNSNRIPSKEVK